MQYRTDRNQQARQEDRIEASLQDNPVTVLARPNLRINTLVGFIAGFFIGGIIVFVLEYLESAIVRRREDVEIFADLPVLAAVRPATDTRNDAVEAIHWIVREDQMTVGLIPKIISLTEKAGAMLMRQVCPRWITAKAGRLTQNPLSVAPLLPLWRRGWGMRGRPSGGSPFM